MNLTENELIAALTSTTGEVAHASGTTVRALNLLDRLGAHFIYQVAELTKKSLRERGGPAANRNTINEIEQLLCNAHPTLQLGMTFEAAELDRFMWTIARRIDGLEEEASAARVEKASQWIRARTH